MRQSTLRTALFGTTLSLFLGAAPAFAQATTVDTAATGTTTGMTTDTDDNDDDGGNMGWLGLLGLAGLLGLRRRPHTHTEHVHRDTTTHPPRV